MDPVTPAGTTPSILAGQTAPTVTDSISTSAPAPGTASGGSAAASSGSLEINWFDGLPDGLKAEKTLETFKGKPISAVVESYVQAQKSFGSRLPVPLPTDKPEERAAKIQRLQQELGRPATPADYKFDLPAYEQLGLQANEAQLTAFKEAAHKMGLTNDQVREIVAWQAQQEAASQPDRHAAASSCVEALKAGDELNPGWGSTMPKFVALAKRAVDMHFSPEVQGALDKAGFFNDPNFIRGMYKMGRALVEDNVLVGEELDTSTGALTAQQELDKIMSDAKGPYFNDRHPKHEETVNRALDLRRFIAKQA